MAKLQKDKTTGDEDEDISADFQEMKSDHAKLLAAIKTVKLRVATE